MTNKEKIMKLQTYKMYEDEDTVYVERDDVLKALEQQPCEDCISRQAAIDAIMGQPPEPHYPSWYAAQIENLPSAQPDASKYEYHYDHTDCIWYRPEARNRCPATCAQYRDGWNDAMNYIFRDGKGYRPYRRGEQYEE